MVSVLGLSELRYHTFHYSERPRTAVSRATPRFIVVNIIGLSGVELILLSNMVDVLKLSRELSYPTFHYGGRPRTES
jgi:hypothetical protein